MCFKFSSYCNYVKVGLLICTTSLSVNGFCSPGGKIKELSRMGEFSHHMEVSKFVDQLEVLLKESIDLGGKETSLMGAFITIWDCVDENYLILPEEDYAAVVSEIADRDLAKMDYLQEVKHKKHKKHKSKKKGKKMKVSSKMAFGFIKFFAGSLCAIIPIPAVQGVGAFLMGQGLHEMIEEARTEGERREKEEEMRAYELHLQSSS